VSSERRGHDGRLPIKGLHMKRVIFAVSMLLTSAATWATPFQGTYDVDVNTQDPGLVVEATPATGSLAFDLDVDEQTDWISLFRISTRETTVNADDQHALQVSIDFDFVEPESFGGTSYGRTEGVSLFWGLVQYGALTWANGGYNSLYFGDTGILDVFLQDVTFGGGFLGLNGSSATVKGKFFFRQATGGSGPGPITVPEPAALTLLGAGLLIVGFVWRRRRKSA
jgi:hypothetical protein